jgi:ferredoxin-nitrate reductase
MSDASGDRIANPWGHRRPFDRAGEWPTRVDVQLEEGIAEADVDRWVQSACVLCSNGCGCDIAVKDNRIVGIRGRAVDRVNRGRLGPKGLYGWQANGSPDRLTTPLLRRNGWLEPVDWDDALDALASRAGDLMGRKGPGSIGVYTTGQLFLEEYYTLALLTMAGFGTNHLDGNTRLCTATASQALKETFGSDGQPSGYRDIDVCDTLFLVGHNMAATQTVLWSRVLDRFDGADPPVLIVVDPRRTPVAERADVHLAIRNGTNVALLNAIVREVIANGWIDAAVEERTVGFEDLAATVDSYTPEKAGELCAVDAAEIRRAAELIGRSERLLITALQGVYQSHQATVAACQLNNLALIRGMVGKPGGGVLQMNGQPTAQNSRETGCAGDLPGFRNWQNPAHVEDLARLWNVEPGSIPHWGPHTDAMQIFRYAEEGSVELLWIIATNPAVSMPELHRIRSILAQDRLFVVVQDAFLTETADVADLVLPGALWGEKTGTFTNADRTVHLSEKAVDPPPGARTDFDIFLDVARRMRFTDRDGNALIPWSTPEECFDAWRECTSGRPCDYTGLSYDTLRGGSGIQWPCNDAAPDGTERLYVDGRYHTTADDAEDYGHDLLTGGAWTEQEFKALGANGKAILKAGEYVPPHEQPDDDYPLGLTTGRSLYHFHTRTKTGRTPELDAAAPDVWVELAPADAARFGVRDGDLVRVESRRGHVEAVARVNGTREGVVFLPFHYGDPDRAANELTLTVWDPVSKQPAFKAGAVRVRRAGEAPR